MGLTNSQYDSILRQYNARRLQAKYTLDKRTEEIYNKYPEILDIDNKIAVQSVRRAKLAILGDQTALDGLSADNQALSLEKKRLLEKHGYPAEYLSPQYTCPLCRDTGFIGSERCSCFKSALTDLIYAESNIRDVIGRENFSTFDFSLYSDAPESVDELQGMTPRANMQYVVSEVHDFIDNFDSTVRNLLIYGECGVGKTFLLNCIAKELLDSAHTVLYYTSYGFFDYLEKCKFRSGEVDEILSSDQLLECDLLLIDDLGTELDTSFTSYALYSVINERALRGHSTVISTNLSPEQLAGRYSDRVFSRIDKDYRFLRIYGDDIRHYSEIAVV